LRGERGLDIGLRKGAGGNFVGSVPHDASASDIGSGASECKLVCACAAGHVARVESTGADLGEVDSRAYGGSVLVALSGDGEAGF